MARTNKSMDGMSILKKAAGIKSNAQTGLQAFGAGLKKKYQAAEAKWEATPRYKKAVKNVKMGNY